jgi:TetR/AcrR family transcriptional regulator
VSQTTTSATAAVSTPERILDAALISIAAKGYDGTSLDSLAATLGVRKQTVLHHFGSKDGLLKALLARSADEVRDAVEAGLGSSGSAMQRIEAVVRAVFRLAAIRPDLLALTRETIRLGGSFTGELMNSLEPLTHRATTFMSAAMDAGELRRHDPRLVLLTAYSTVIGAATEVEVLRQLGVAPSVRILVRRRRELIDELRAVLAPRETLGRS